MKIAIFGAGAVGCYIGGMLARRGTHDVVFIGRADHVEAINVSGLALESIALDLRVRARASVDAAAAGDADVVLVCVKATDTARAADALADHVRPHAIVVSLQNGVEGAAELSRRLGRGVVPSVVYVACEMVGPGHVKHHGRSELVVQEGYEGAVLERACQGSGVTLVQSPDIRQAQWSKLILNCAYNALSAVSRKAMGEMVPVPGLEDTMLDIIRECNAVALAEGVKIEMDAERQLARIMTTIPRGQHASMAHDLSLGRRTEIEQLNGVIVRRGASHGIPTPVNQALLLVVRLIEAPSAIPVLASPCS